jgi:predicted small secreted protein
MARRFIALLMITGGIALAGCNTIEGVGRDIKSVGEEVSDAAD